MRVFVLSSTICALVWGCSGQPEKRVEPPAGATVGVTLSSNVEAESGRSAPAATPEPALAPAPDPDEARAPTKVASPPARSAPVPSGHDFVKQARLIYRIAACGSDEPVTGRFSPRAVARHCAQVRKHFNRFRMRWSKRAGTFIAGLRPTDVPSTVVYPFGGGDLVSALVVFPEAREITTISLEAAGDPRTIEHLAGARLREDLRIIRGKYQRLLRAHYSTTKSLQIASHSRLAGTVMFALSALSLHRFEPVSLRYFDIEDDGSLRYLDESELDARAARVKAGKPARKHKSRQFWREQVAAFANMEIQFRPRGASADEPVRVYRHIVANLDDPHLADGPQVLAHLRKKGQVAVMTKAASYLLWLDEFSSIRTYILKHAQWMISDSSGVPPSYASTAGYEQVPYGQFTRPFFTRDPKRVSKQMIKLWAESPKRRLGFRFGYPDGAGKSHLLVMRRR